MAATKPSGTGSDGGGEVASDVTELSYSDAGAQLDTIIEEFETGVVDVDRLVEQLERATDIVDELDRRLRRTRMRVEELVPRLESIGSTEDSDDTGPSDDEDDVIDVDPAATSAGSDDSGSPGLF
jgi:exodeoxyribonuclease VII small subunit